jgi:O-antigen/teichoic acid export membrane protein
VNFTLGIAIARVGTPAEFGAYGLVFGAYLISINVTRPLAIEPLIIRFTGAQRSDWRSALGSATGIVVLTGLALAAAGLVIGLVAGGFVGLAFTIVSLGLPALVLQDAWRLAFFAEARGRAAFLNDLGWALVLFPTIAILVTQGLAVPATLLAAWVAGGVFAALLGLLQAGTRPHWSPQWWRDQRDLARPLLGEHVATNILTELTPYAIGAVAGLSAVAALRAAQLLLGPFNLVFQALSLIALPEAVRLAGRSHRRLLQAAIVFSAILSGAVIAVGVLIVALPDDIGARLLGATWSVAEPTMLPYALFVGGVMAGAGALVGLRALGEGRETFRVGVIRSALSFVGAIGGAIVGGAPTAALGMAGGQWLGGIEAWRAFVAALGRHASVDPKVRIAASAASDPVPD